MKRKLIALSGVVLCGALAACGTPKDAQELSQKTVEYRCGASGEQPLSVQYTFQGGEPLAAKVIYNNTAVDLTRTTSSNTDMTGNTFKGNGYAWTTDKFTLENVDTVNGNMFTQESTQVVNGQNAAVSNILAKDCKVGS
jgi:membrane-bound inhibitor of C-type lysozyme